MMPSPRLLPILALALLTLLAGGAGFLKSCPPFLAGHPVDEVPIVSSAPIVDTPARHAGADESWFTTVSAELQRQEYQATPGLDGLQAPNRAQNLRTTFHSRGIEVAPRVIEERGAWQFDWKTTGWGRLGRMQEIVSAAPVLHGSRITYEREGWSEWYENTAEGLEQGFTVSRRPPGPGPLRIEGALRGGLRAELRDGAVDLLDAHGACVLRYGKLIALDAKGRVLPSWLTLEGRDLAIQVDDLCAEYPLTIDPLMTSPAWTAEGNQSVARLGASVATAGDVNGDGFSDVIVGVHGYDNGQADEGRSYVFHGTASGLAASPAWISECNQAGAYFGHSVAAAGDVNGDGFADVIVGALFYDNGQSDEGRSFVYLGSAAGLAASPAWIAECNQANAYFGNSVGTAGDVNGDGFADVIVGAYTYDNGQSDEGRAFVYLGSATGLAASPAWIAECNQADAYFGSSVGTAGDVNADGFADVIISAMNFTNGQIDEGRCFAYRGSSSGLGLSPAWTTEGNQASANFGASVATAGDVNGDGFSDVIVGAAYYENGQSDEGKAFVYQGSAAGLVTFSSWTAEGNQSSARFGCSVATAGDVNSDGFADIIVGAYAYSNDQGIEGRAVVYYGSTVGVATSPAWTGESGQNLTFYGSSVATAGDVNGDGCSDVIVGAPQYSNGQANEGRAFVYHGSAEGLAGTSSWDAEGNQANAGFGWSAGSAGDVNGDGYSDVIVGADTYENGQTGEGRAWLYLGGAGGLELFPAWSVEGNQEWALLGYSLGTAGDVNGDGYSDVIISLPLYDNGQVDEGVIWIFHGSAAGLSTSPSSVREVNQASAIFGAWVGTAGDVNGDGFSDVIVSADSYDNGQTDEGRAFVYHGSAGGLGGSPAWTAESGQANAHMWKVATAGDVNADGYSDVMVAAHDYDNGQIDEGRVWGFLGSATGLRANPAWTFESQQESAKLGYALGTAGDVNGDGFSDIIIGAPSYTIHQSDEGKAYVFQGEPDGISILPTWTSWTNQAGAAFGWSVGTAGDVNGDGYSEIIVAAPGYDDDQINEGRVWMCNGSSTGTQQAHTLFIDSDQDGAELGQVATAGDVNGDGYSDVIIGANKYDNGQSNEGRAFVYLGNAGGGLDRIPRQARTNNSAPIDLLGLSDSGTSFRLKSLARTPAGRGRVRLQWEVKPAGVPFNGAGLVTSSAVNTGAPTGAGSAVTLSALVTGLTPETLYHWRLRVLTDSPFFPRSRWLWLPGNAGNEADVRTRTNIIGITDSSSPESPQLLLQRSVPNPFTTSTQVGYTLPEAGRLRLAVYDVTGRQVAMLADGVERAGHYEVTWNGRASGGKQLPAGVYFLRFEFAGAIETQKIVLSR